MKRLIAAFLLGLCAPAMAQQSIQQAGTVTPGHAYAVVTNGVAGDAGPATPATGALSSLGVVNTGLGLCAQNLPTAQTYTSLCLGYISGAPTITLSGPGAPTSLNFNLNGVTFSLPSSNSGNVTVSGTPTAGQIAEWTSATAIQGVAPGTLITTVNGQPCAVAGSCTITTAAGAVTIGTTSVSGGTSGSLLYDNAGTLGNEAVSTLAIGASQLTGTTLPAGIVSSSLTGVGTITSGTWQGTPLANAYLANSAVTVNSTVCTLGSSCSITATAASMTVGTTTVLSGTTAYVLYDNAGVLGAEPSSSLTIAAANLTGTTLPSSIVTSSLTSVGTIATGVWNGTAIANAFLQNASTTVNGTVCTLGSSCSPTATATSITIGTTTVGSGTNGDLLYDNAGTLGNEAASALSIATTQLTGSSLPSGITGSSLTSVGTIGTGVWQGTAIANTYLANPLTTVNGTTCTLGATCTVTAVASSVAVGTTAVTSGTTGDLLYNNGGTLGNETLASILVSPPAIGGTTPAAGAFTTLSASSTVSGTGFSTYLASPPAIGGTAPAAGSFTTITASSTITPTSTIGIVGTTTNDNVQAGSVGEFIQATDPLSTLAVTITIASPAVITWTSHGLSANDAVYFTTSGALPTGLTTNTTYYVVGSSITANTFEVATSVANAIANTPINTSGTQSGTQTAFSAAFMASASVQDLTAIQITAGDWDVWGTVAMRAAPTTTVSAISAGINTTANTLPGIGNGPRQEFVFTGTTGQEQDVTTGPFRYSVASTTTLHLVGLASFGTSTMQGYGNIQARRRR